MSQRERKAHLLDRISFRALVTQVGDDTKKICWQRRFQTHCTMFSEAKTISLIGTDSIPQRSLHVL